MYRKVLLKHVMTENKNHTDDLKVIRKMMEESSRFLSLSGLSGIVVGLIALSGVIASILFILEGDAAARLDLFPAALLPGKGRLMVFVALLVLAGAIAVATILAAGESRRKGVEVWTPVTRLLLYNLLIPLIAGGAFIIVLADAGSYQLIVPAMLIFYGLALFNSGKFTFGEVQFLGVLEVVTGVLAAMVTGYDLIFWATGFGLLHIMYGFILHRKYS